jgi:nicotinamide riboside kinase
MENRPQILACVGPESTGKTTLCLELADTFNGVVVPEIARGYLENRDGKYVQSDLEQIAELQLNAENRIISKNQSLIFCDTDLLVVKVWYEFKYRQSNSKINGLLAQQPPRKYLLTYPDLEWIKDPLRENPEDLLELFHIYESELKKMGAEFRVIKGVDEERLSNALEAMNQMNFG